MPIVGCVTRLVHQKGIHLIKHAAWRTLERGGQFVLLGSAPDPRVQVCACLPAFPPACLPACAKTNPSRKGQQRAPNRRTLQPPELTKQPPGRVQRPPGPADPAVPRARLPLVCLRRAAESPHIRRERRLPGAVHVRAVRADSDGGDAVGLRGSALLHASALFGSFALLQSGGVCRTASNLNSEVFRFLRPRRRPQPPLPPARASLTPFPLRQQPPLRHSTPSADHHPLRPSSRSFSKHSPRRSAPLPNKHPPPAAPPPQVRVRPRRAQDGGPGGHRLRRRPRRGPRRRRGWEGLGRWGGLRGFGPEA